MGRLSSVLHCGRTPPLHPSPGSRNERRALHLETRPPKTGRGSGAPGKIHCKGVSRMPWRARLRIMARGAPRELHPIHRHTGPEVVCPRLRTWDRRGKSSERGLRARGAPVRPSFPARRERARLAGRRPRAVRAGAPPLRTLLSCGHSVMRLAGGWEGGGGRRGSGRQWLPALPPQPHWPTRAPTP